jgi:hypothetical protein
MEIIVNHFKVSCEYSDLTKCYNVFFEWLDGSNFQFLGCVNSIEEWEIVKVGIEKLCIKRGLTNFDYHDFMRKYNSLNEEQNN